MHNFLSKKAFKKRHIVYKENELQYCKNYSFSEIAYLLILNFPKKIYLRIFPISKNNSVANKTIEERHDSFGADSLKTIRIQVWHI